jgi:hypothetical protein
MECLTPMLTPMPDPDDPDDFSDDFFSLGVDSAIVKTSRIQLN